MSPGESLGFRGDVGLATCIAFGVCTVLGPGMMQDAYGSHNYDVQWVLENEP